MNLLNIMLKEDEEAAKREKEEKKRRKRGRKTDPSMAGLPDVSEENKGKLFLVGSAALLHPSAFCVMVISAILFG